MQGLSVAMSATKLFPSPPPKPTQAAQQQERFAIFVEAPRCDEQYVSLKDELDGEWEKWHALFADED